MNAHDRITERLTRPEAPLDATITSFGTLRPRDMRDLAEHVTDVVIAVLPDLLTDLEVEEAVAWDLDPVDGMPDTRPSLRAALAAAARAITGGAS